MTDSKIYLEMLNGNIIPYLINNNNTRNHLFQNHTVMQKENFDKNCSTMNYLFQEFNTKGELWQHKQHQTENHHTNYVQEWWHCNVSKILNRYSSMNHWFIILGTFDHRRISTKEWYKPFIFRITETSISMIIKKKLFAHLDC